MAIKIITISRQFGSGGRSIGKKLAERLGFEYFDKEIIDYIYRIKPVFSLTRLSSIIFVKIS